MDPERSGALLSEELEDAARPRPRAAAAAAAADLVGL